MKDACWCIYCHYTEYDSMSPLDKGCCFAAGGVCCYADACRSTACCNGNGCVAATIKYGCSLFHGKILPGNTPGYGCGPMMCGRNLDRDPSKLSPREQGELDCSEPSSCFFARCLGFGCNSPNCSNSRYKVKGKLCCLWADLETDTCCDDGWIKIPARSRSQRRSHAGNRKDSHTSP